MPWALYLRDNRTRYSPKIRQGGRRDDFAKFEENYLSPDGIRNAFSVFSCPYPRHKNDCPILATSNNQNNSNNNIVITVATAILTKPRIVNLVVFPHKQHDLKSKFVGIPKQPAM
jgi:hypothetical protein